MSLEQGPPPTTVTAQNVGPPAVSNVVAPTSQLMQQLQQPLDVKPPVNNPSSSVNKNISIPNQSTAKLEQQQQPSPTGNNNKSNINLNHMTQPAPIPTVNPMNPTSSLPQQMQQMNTVHLSGMHGNGMHQQTPNVSTPSIIQQQLTNNNSNPIQVKQQTAFAPMNAFIDPLEQSLASLEHPQTNNNSQKNPSQDMNAMLYESYKQQMLINSITVAPHIGHGPGSNGFVPDFNGANGAVNNLMNMLAIPSMDPSSLFLNSQMKNVPGRFPDTWNNMPVGNQMMQLSVQQQQQQHHMQHQQQNHQPQQHQQQPSTKQEKIMLTPKPIEELLMNPSDKTKGLGGPSGGPNFGQAFNKYEQNLKNASSWSQLAAAGSPQNPGTSISTSSKAKVPSDTFQEYRTKAKEQAQRQKQEQEKMKMKKEQEMKRQQESMQKHKSDDLSNGHRYKMNILT